MIHILAMMGLAFLAGFLTVGFGVAIARFFGSTETEADFFRQSVPISVTSLKPEPGEVLHVGVGMDMGDGLPPWIPGPDELEHVRQMFEELLPDTPVLVTHMGIELSSHEAPTRIEIADIDEDRLYAGSD